MKKANHELHFKAAIERALAAATCAGLVLALANCGSSNSNDNACTPPDQDGVNGGYDTEYVSISDTAFSVGGVDSGSTEKNISVQNLAIVTLIVTNTGTTPHDLVVQCIPTGLPASCMNPTSCFDNPLDAGMSTPNSTTLIPPLMPGESMTVTVQTPLVEGVYNFISDVPGDDTTFETDGGVAGGLTGDFVLM